MTEPPKTISGPTPGAPRIAIARLGVVNRRSEEVSSWVDVHFNPASLQLQVSNELKDTRNNERKQYIARSNAKLTMELQFDTTDSGKDVTETTRKLQAFITHRPPPVVMFEWGRVTFKGIAESYKETIDFFSASGVPLRASVNLTLSRQDQVFDDAGGGAAAGVGVPGDTAGFNAPPASAADLSNAGEAPGAARSVAAANAQETLRFGDGEPMTVGGTVDLKPPVAFAGGGGLGGGLGLGLGGGLDFGIGAGSGAAAASIGLNASAGISDQARLSAAEGAFNFLRVPPPAGSAARIDTSRLQPDMRSATLATDRNATFDVGGKATLDDAPGLRADVGSRPSTRGRLTFDTL